MYKHITQDTNQSTVCQSTAAAVFQLSTHFRLQPSLQAVWLINAFGLSFYQTPNVRYLIQLTLAYTDTVYIPPSLPIELGIQFHYILFNKSRGVSRSLLFQLMTHFTSATYHQHRQITEPCNTTILSINNVP